MPLLLFNRQEPSEVRVASPMEAPRDRLYIGGPVYRAGGVSVGSCPPSLDVRALQRFVAITRVLESHLLYKPCHEDIGVITDAWITNDTLYIAATVLRAHPDSPLVIAGITEGVYVGFQLHWDKHPLMQEAVTGVSVCEKDETDVARIEYISWDTPYVHRSKQPHSKRTPVAPHTL